MKAAPTDFDAPGPHDERPGSAHPDGNGAWRWIIWISCAVIDLLLVAGMVWWLWG
jgi:hypothetical protein